MWSSHRELDFGGTFGAVRMTGIGHLDHDGLDHREVGCHDPALPPTRDLSYDRCQLRFRRGMRPAPVIATCRRAFFIVDAALLAVAGTITFLGQGAG